MATVTTSPNMKLPVPVPSDDPGPDWAANIVACFGSTGSGIDGHDHSPQKGVPITPLGLNINAPLSMNDQSLTNTNYVQLLANSAALSGSITGIIYRVGPDLYYNDGAGDQIAITANGAVAGTNGSIGGLTSPASASYAAGTFTWQSAVNTPAAMAQGPTTIAQQIAGGKGVTLLANASQAANYNITLPVAVATVVSSSLVSDTSGNLSYVPLVGSTYNPTVISDGVGSGQAAVGPFFYQRIGNIVTGYGSLVGETDGSGQLSFLVTLPILPTNNFANVYDICGIVSGGFVSGHTIIGSLAVANTGTKTLEVAITYSAPATVLIPITVSFTYNCS